MNDKQVILVDPHPRKLEMIFSEDDKRRLESLAEVIWFAEERPSEELFDEYLPRTVAIVGSPAMDRQRLERAPRLRVIAETSGNYPKRIDYEECHRRNIHVLCCAPAFAAAVAEMSLALAMAAARDIPLGDASFRGGSEIYGGPSNRGCFLLHGKRFGIIGCGNIGRTLIPMLRPFGGEIVVHDPWVHDRLLEEMGVRPVGLEELLRSSRVVFILSAPTAENRASLRKEHFDMMSPGSVVVLTSRAGVVDFDALLDAAESGHIKAAIDVFPEEPVPPTHRVRNTPNTILSAHRAGGLAEAYYEIGRMIVDDLELILKNLPPQRMQKACLELVERRFGKTKA